MADLNAGKKVSSLSLGVMVIILYGLFVSSVTFGFGSYIYRTAWQVENGEISSGDGESSIPADIDNLLFILKREKDLERAKEAVTAQIQQQRREEAEMDVAVQQSFGAIALAKAALRSQVELTMADLQEFQFELPGPGRSKFESVVDLMDRDAAEVNNLAPDSRVRALLGVAAEGFNGPGVDLDTKTRFDVMHAAALDKFDALKDDIDAANAASHGVQAQRKLVQDRIATLQARWDGHNDSIKALQETVPVGSPERARLSALSLNTPILPDILMRLVSFPTIFLTLIVTIAAGGLGTVVAFSRRYYSSKPSSELTMSRLFVNVGEGIAAAIAIFLFSGAGMLALTQGGGAVNDVELSPYTVAFVAFLSGFMAEDAFASIQAAGKRIFNTEDKDAPKETGSGANLPAVVPETVPAEADQTEPPGTTAPPSS